MPTFEPWTIIKVPFPHNARPVRQRRPALVVAAGNTQQDHGLLWVVMITSAENRGWPGDVPVSYLSASGLQAPSVVRTAKIATIEAKEAEAVGRLPEADRGTVRRLLLGALAQAAN